MRILVTGGTGMLGRDLAHELAGRGHVVLTPGRSELDVTVARDLERLRRRDFGLVDWVVNCAAYTAVDQAEEEAMAAMRLNAVAPGGLAVACLGAEARLLHVSTDFVFDGEAESAYGEEAGTRPLGVYGRSKREGELNVLRENPEAVVLRTSWLFGAEGRSFPRTMIEAWAGGRSLRVVGDQVGKPTSTVDLSRVIGDVVEMGLGGGIYHAAGPEVESWHGFAVRAVECWRDMWRPGSEVVIEAIGTSDWPTRARRPRFSVLDTGKLEASGVAAMRPLGESLAEFCLRVGDIG